MTVVALALVGLGCSGIGVKPGDMELLVASFQFSLNQDDQLSPRSRQTLRQLDLEGVYEERPFEAFTRLQTLIADPAPPDMLFALAELGYQFGMKAEKRRHPVAVRYYYFSA